MAFEELAKRGLVLLGCGKMGSAMVDGWIKAGLPHGSIHIIDPGAGDYLNGLAAQGVHLNQPLPVAPALLLLAVKPQMMDAALPQVTHLGGGPTLVVSVAAGTPIATFEAAFGAQTPIVRAMPNTPAAIGQGITAIIGNTATTAAHIDLADTVLQAIGQTVRLEAETQIDAVTGVSGSGPAYVFHLIECLAAAGEAEGLPADLAMTLAQATVAGAGALAVADATPPDQLRRNVTSPNGTTQAGLEVLMADPGGLPDLIRATVKAAAGRSRELAR